MAIKLNKSLKGIYYNYLLIVNKNEQKVLNRCQTTLGAYVSVDIRSIDRDKPQFNDDGSPILDDSGKQVIKQTPECLDNMIRDPDFYMYYDTPYNLTDEQRYDYLLTLPDFSGAIKI